EALRGGAPPGDELLRLPTRIPARRGTRVVLLDPAEILWFEAEETIVFARTADARLIVDRSLGDLERQLGRAFFRTHRRYLVNVSQIREIQPGEGGNLRVVMRDEARSAVPLSRRQARELRELIPW
ncbi:MAG TPA: LytTR family DNA-binding domain-containing protein, partial [Candidatus Dormibacteraeota bacterium]|nr:LytTR family DNA-binding domain-containing protein [Candidatus Dormibacteraeota bacterium]